jgi:cobalt-zinc-cadmium efflux system outer membrane protein
LGARVRQALDENHAQLVQVETEYAQAVRRIELAQENSQRLLKTAQLQLALATQRTTLTQDSLALREKSFALGESDLPTLLRARAAHFDAQALLHRQQINAHAAVSRVNQSLGVLP